MKSKLQSFRLMTNERHFFSVRDSSVSDFKFALSKTNTVALKAERIVNILCFKLRCLIAQEPLFHASPLMHCSSTKPLVHTSNCSKWQVVMPFSICICDKWFLKLIKDMVRPKSWHSSKKKRCSSSPFDLVCNFLARLSVILSPRLALLTAFFLMVMKVSCKIFKDCTMLTGSLKYEVITFSLSDANCLLGSSFYCCLTWMALLAESEGLLACLFPQGEGGNEDGRRKVFSFLREMIVLRWISMSSRNWFSMIKHCNESGRIFLGMTITWELNSLHFSKEWMNAGHFLWFPELREPKETCSVNIKHMEYSKCVQSKYYAFIS